MQGGVRDDDPLLERAGACDIDDRAGHAGDAVSAAQDPLVIVDRRAVGVQQPATVATHPDRICHLDAPPGFAEQVDAVLASRRQVADHGVLAGIGKFGVDLQKVTPFERRRRRIGSLEVGARPEEDPVTPAELPLDVVGIESFLEGLATQDERRSGRPW